MSPGLPKKKKADIAKKRSGGSTLKREALVKREKLD